MAPLSGEWLEALKGEFHQPYYVKLYKTVMQEYQSRKIFPPADDMFNAFHFTPLSQVKVVILGQDPYHNDGQAHGLCFSDPCLLLDFLLCFIFDLPVNRLQTVLN